MIHFPDNLAVAEMHFMGYFLLSFTYLFSSNEDETHLLILMRYMSYKITSVTLFLYDASFSVFFFFSFFYLK